MPLAGLSLSWLRLTGINPRLGGQMSGDKSPIPVMPYDKLRIHRVEPNTDSVAEAVEPQAITHTFTLFHTRGLLVPRLLH